MQHKFAVEALERTLREILKPVDIPNDDAWDKPFGGITVLFGRDFHQTLPVIPKGTHQEIVSASICRSDL